jgi:hypothetical protein
MQAVIDNHEFVRFEHGAYFHAVFFVVPYRDDHARSWPAADRPWTPDEFDPGGPLNGGSLLLPPDSNVDLAVSVAIPYAIAQS